MKRNFFLLRYKSTLSGFLGLSSPNFPSGKLQSQFCCWRTDCRTGSQKKIKGTKSWWIWSFGNQTTTFACFETKKTSFMYKIIQILHKNSTKIGMITTNRWQNLLLKYTPSVLPPTKTCSCRMQMRINHPSTASATTNFWYLKSTSFRIGQIFMNKKIIFFFSDRKNLWDADPSLRGNIYNIICN